LQVVAEVLVEARHRLALILQIAPVRMQVMAAVHTCGRPLASTTALAVVAELSSIVQVQVTR